MGKRNARNHEFRRSLLHHVVPVMVWLATVASVIGLFAVRAQHIEVVGLARSRILTVSTLTPGRITSLPVELYQPVKKGQTVAVVNTLADNEDVSAQLEAQQETLRAQIDHLKAQLLPTQERLTAEAASVKTSLEADYRSFALDVETIQLRILELKTQIATDRLTLESLAAKIKTTRQLIDQDVIDASELEPIQLQHNALLAGITENETLLNEAKTQLAQAEKRRDEFKQTDVQTPSVENALEVIRKEIDVYNKRMNEINSQLEQIQQRQALQLKAPFDGYVTRIDGTLTEVADVNQPILMITESNPTQVVGYIENYNASEIHSGMMIQVVQLGETIKMSTCQVTAVGQVVEQLPRQLWRDPSLPQWGRPFLVDVQDLNLVAGEKVGLRPL